MAQNSIGSFLFTAFDGARARGAPPWIPADRIEVIERPGVNGSAIRLLGKKREAFQMISGVGTATRPIGNELSKDYQRSQGEIQPLFWAGDDFSDVMQVGILHVEPLRVITLGAASDGSGAWVEAVWTLKPMLI